MPCTTVGPSKRHEPGGQKSRKSGRQIVTNFDRFREVVRRGSTEFPNRQKRPKIPAKRGNRGQCRASAGQPLKWPPRRPESAATRAQKKPDLMGNQIRLVGWEYQPAGDWKTKSRDKKTGADPLRFGGEGRADVHRKQVAAGLFCLRRQARTTVIDGINGTLQKEAIARHNRYARRTFPILPSVRRETRDSGRPAVALLASRLLLASPGGQMTTAIWGPTHVEAASNDF
jgi:hypothetical protein